MLTSSFSIIYLLIVLLLFGRVDADQIIDTQTLSCNGASGGVKVHQTVFSDTIKNVQWLGNKTGEKVIYLLTESLSLYRSVDDGKIFTSIENILANNGPNPEITLVIPTTSALKTWFLGRKGDLWSTSNLGVSYHLHPIKVVTIQPNPEDPSQALATVATNCTSFDCVYELWYTKDSVAWTKIKELVSDYFWGRNGKIFVESWKSKSVHYSRWDCYLSSSTDEGHTWKDVAQHVVGSAIGREVLWVVRKKSEDSPSLQLLSSRNRGDDPLNLALLPTELPQNMFTVLDVDEDFIILNIQHQDARWGNVYISDDTDSNFALSLERNPRNVHGHVDFMPLESIDGIYFANAYLDDISLNNNDLTTLASFTYAGSWNVINPPTKDANGQPIACPGCTLHFHLKKKSSDTEDTYGAFHSNMNALGLILATGNIGPFLSTSNTNLYLSDDGGVTWSEIGEGGHVYEFADHGGVIMKALDSTTTSSVQYTWDQGKSWTTCDFGINPTEFHQILSEQTSTGLNFLLYGATSTQGSMKGIVMAIDLDDDKPRQCDTSPGSSDYEFWSLADTSISGMATQCFLGETKAIRRRVPSVACYDPLETQDTNVTKICECTLADYECDYCFKPYSTTDRRCVQDCPTEEIPSLSPPSVCHGHWNMTQGHRLTVGNKCKGGVNKNPVPQECPNYVPPEVKPGDPKDSTQAIALIVILSIAGFLVLVVGGLLLVGRNTGLKGLLRHLPRRMRDPFRGTGFVRLSSRNHDDLLDHEDEAHELDEDGNRLI